MSFTVSDYTNWPDSFEQSARDRLDREAREKQMVLSFPIEDEEDADA